MSVCPSPSRRSLAANAEGGGAERTLLEAAGEGALDGASAAAAPQHQGIDSMSAAAYSGFTLVALFASGLAVRRVLRHGAEDKTSAAASPVK